MAAKRRHPRDHWYVRLPDDVLLSDYVKEAFSRGESVKQVHADMVEVANMFPELGIPKYITYYYTLHRRWEMRQK